MRMRSFCFYASRPKSARRRQALRLLARAKNAASRVDARPSDRWRGALRRLRRLLLYGQQMLEPTRGALARSRVPTVLRTICDEDETENVRACSGGSVGTDGGHTHMYRIVIANMVCFGFVPIAE